MRLVLASGSPRRLDLLRAGGVDPVVRPTNVDETPEPGESPAALVRRLARAKVAASDADLVLGADTEVARDGTVLGKPADEAAAVAMLQAASGRVLTVWSGIALRDGATTTTRVVGSFVRFHHLSDATIADYVATGEPFGAAGAFRIQGQGRDLVAATAGCWTNVVGLPTCQAARLLARAGVPLAGDDCQASTAS